MFQVKPEPHWPANDHGILWPQCDFIRSMNLPDLAVEAEFHRCTCGQCTQIGQKALGANALCADLVIYQQFRSLIRSGMSGFLLNRPALSGAVVASLLLGRGSNGDAARDL
jgi:hypothetical protein